VSGIFITFEGGEGAGKSTQIKHLAQRLTENGDTVALTREPGGSPGAEVLRHVLLSGAAEPFGAEREVMLFAAARLDHMRETILPALARGAVVLCDRFYDSTRAYQGAGGGVSAAYLAQMEAIAVGDRHPDLTIILDIDPKLGLERVNARLAEQKSRTGNKMEVVGLQQIDRFEKEALSVHEKRRNAFLTIARGEPERCIVVDASQDAKTVSDVIWTLVCARLPALHHTPEAPLS